MAGGASLEFIQQVVADADGGGDLDAWTVIDALDVLVDRSLVAVLSAPLEDGPASARRATACSNPRAPTRWSGFDAAGEHAALRQRHAKAMAAMVRCRL